MAPSLSSKVNLAFGVIAVLILFTNIGSKGLVQGGAYAAGQILVYYLLLVIGYRIVGAFRKGRTEGTETAGN